MTLPDADADADVDAIHRTRRNVRRQLVQNLLLMVTFNL